MSKRNQYTLDKEELEFNVQMQANSERAARALGFASFDAFSSFMKTGKKEARQGPPKRQKEERKEDRELEALEAKLSSEQKQVVEAVTGKNQSVFFTGCAGTGKSFLLTYLRKRFEGRRDIFFTASTGLAAVNIGGTTLHSFAGIGLAQESAQVLAETICARKTIYDRWTACRALVIDEISMISGELFDKIEEVARLVRGKEKPFGGIQLILCGDFLQLPPVKADLFCFQARSWSACVNLQMELTTVFRQNNKAFVGMLNEIRNGVCSAETEKALRARVHAVLPVTNGIQPTQLYALRNDVDRENRDEMDKLKGRAYGFTATDEGSSPFVNQLKDCAAAPAILLKEGAQVMLVANVNTDDGLCNGTRGIVVGFVPMPEGAGINAEERMAPRVLWANDMETIVVPYKFTVTVGGREMASRKQLPLALAWALTIHKSQGSTLDKAVVTVAGIFEDGQAYVALSRLKSLEGLSLTSFDPKVIRAKKAVLEFYKCFGKPSDS